MTSPSRAALAADLERFLDSVRQAVIPCDKEIDSPEVQAKKVPFDRTLTIGEYRLIRESLSSKPGAWAEGVAREIVRLVNPHWAEAEQESMIAAILHRHAPASYDDVTDEMVDRVARAINPHAFGPITHPHDLVAMKDAYGIDLAPGEIHAIGYARNSARAAIRALLASAGGRE